MVKCSSFFLGFLLRFINIFDVLLLHCNFFSVLFLFCEQVPVGQHR
jgi:hypothetical protein